MNGRTSVQRLSMRTRLGRTPHGTTVAVGFCAATIAISKVGAAPLATPAFVTGALGIALWLSRDRPLASAEFTLWLWLLAPVVRRVVDQATGFHDPSLALAAAPLASLALLPHVRWLRWRQLSRLVRPLLVASTAIAMAYVVGAIRIGLRPASGMLLLWLVPVVFGLQVVAVCRDAGELRAAIDRFFVWGTVVVGAYGLVQFYVAPPWDAYWMSNVAMSSIGSPEPFRIRVFSTLNSPGVAATFVTAAVLYLTGSRHPVRFIAQLLGFVCLALTTVRSAWFACVLGLAVVVIKGQSRARVSALVALALLAVGAMQLPGPIQTVVADRIEETREGRQDDSFIARVALHQRLLPDMVDDVAGRGLGSSGTAVRLDPNSPQDLVSLDSGLLDYGYSLGLPAGLLALTALTFGAMDMARVGLRSGTVPVNVVAAGMSVLVQMIGGNTLLGAGGITFFALWAHAFIESRSFALSNRPVEIT